MSTRAVSILFLSLGARAVVADEKSACHLFRPTPREWMRDMSTDRPDKTESPFTVDAGHFQLEMDVLNYSEDRYTPERNHTRVEGVSLAPMNLKVGLWNNVDLQLALAPHTSVRVSSTRTGSRLGRRQGFGNITTRLKINVWGNDGGATAFALMPCVTLPTSQDGLGNNSVEGGLILPFAADLPHGFGLGVMTEVDCVRDDSGNDRHQEYVNSITLNHGIAGNLGAYAEFFSSVSSESGSSWTGTADLGLTYGLTENIQLDAGINIGVTRSADDLNPFCGISWRF